MTNGRRKALHHRERSRQDNCYGGTKKHERRQEKEIPKGSTIARTPPGQEAIRRKKRKNLSPVATDSGKRKHLHYDKNVRGVVMKQTQRKVTWNKWKTKELMHMVRKE